MINFIRATIMMLSSCSDTNTNVSNLVTLRKFKFVFKQIQRLCMIKYQERERSIEAP